MIINNVNGDSGSGGPITWIQSAKGKPEKLTGDLKYGEYTAPFKPVGEPPYTVVIDASRGFTVDAIESPDTMITFLNQGSSTVPIVTVQQD